MRQAQLARSVLPSPDSEVSRNHISYREAPTTRDGGGVALEARIYSGTRQGDRRQEGLVSQGRLAPLTQPEVHAAGETGYGCDDGVRGMTGG